MGNMHAAEYSNAVDEGLLTLENALRVHLGSNHFPPIPAEFIPTALKAIELGDEAQFNQNVWDDVIELPDGATWKGQTGAPVRAIVAWMHLDAFLTPVDEYVDYS